MGNQAEEYSNQMEIIVNPSELKKKADEVSGYIKKINRKFLAIENKVMSSKQYWIGAAGEMHRKTYKEKSEQFIQTMKTLETHTTKLQQIAQGYEETEHTIVNEVKELPINILQ